MTVTLGAIITGLIQFSALAITYLPLIQAWRICKIFVQDFDCAAHHDIHQGPDFGWGHPVHERFDWHDVRFARPSDSPTNGKCSIYYIFFIAIMRIPPERLQKPFIVSSILFGGTYVIHLFLRYIGFHPPQPHWSACMGCIQCSWTWAVVQRARKSRSREYRMVYDVRNHIGLGSLVCDFDSLMKSLID